MDSVLLKAAKRGDADTMALAIHAGANPRAVDDLLEAGSRIFSYLS